MDETAVAGYITGTFEGVETVTAFGATFFFFGSERMFPFATLTTSDENDQFSNLNRPDVYRLNIGVSKATFKNLFDAVRDYDFTALDRIMPHPVYGKMYWVCVLNPGTETFEVVRSLLAEAYSTAKAGHERRTSSGE
jgi:hypothetical protein